MAKRRMFSIALVEADSFYELSPLSQALYFHLNLNADDDGLVDNVRSVMRDLKASKNNLSQLIDGGYLIELDKKVMAITHWNQHNRIKGDRYTKTTYNELMSKLRRDENDRYFKASEDFFGNICAPQDRKGKDSTVEDSKAKESLAEHRAEEKREEKKYNSLFHTDIQTASASQNSADATAINDLSIDSLTLQALKNNIRLYFMKKYNTVNTFGLIEHCEANNWLTEDGRPIAECYKDYAEEWMKLKMQNSKCRMQN